MSQNGNGLLEYIPGSHTLLVQKNSSLPLEGFSENVQGSIQEYAENAKAIVTRIITAITTKVVICFSKSYHIQNRVIIQLPSSLNI